MSNICNTEDVIDVRNIISRVEELRENRGGWVRTQCEEMAMEEFRAIELWAKCHDEEAVELQTLESLLSALCGKGGDEQWEGDWYPITLVRDSYFTDYAQELVSDIGDIPCEIPSYIEIDWEATARNIRMDYSAVEFDGVTYWCR